MVLPHGYHVAGDWAEMASSASRSVALRGTAMGMFCGMGFPEVAVRFSTAYGVLDARLASKDSRSVFRSILGLVHCRGVVLSRLRQSSSELVDLRPSRRRAGTGCSSMAATIRTNCRPSLRVMTASASRSVGFSILAVTVV